MNTPDVFILQKLQAHELTDTNSRIYCDGQFFPISIIHGVAAGQYDQPIYRLSEVQPANGINTLNNPGATA
jgi:hypothetical protein